MPSENAQETTSQRAWTAGLSEAQLNVIEELRQKREASLARIPSRGGQQLPSALEATRLQPQAIAATLTEGADSITELAHDLAKRPIQRWIAAGCGDSYFIALAVRYAFEQLTGLPFEAAQALEFSRYGSARSSAKTPFFAISSSGTVPRTLEALWLAQNQGAPTIAVTNSPGSPLYEVAEHALTIRAGRPGPPTQSSTAAIAALLDLAIGLAAELGTRTSAQVDSLRRELHRMPELMRGVISQCEEPMKALAERLHGQSNINYVGAGPNWGTANFGYAKIREATWDHSMSWQTEEYDHELTYQLPRGEPVFVVAPAGESYDRNAEIALAVHRDEGLLISIVTEGDERITALSDVVVSIPQVSEIFSPLLAVVPLQFFALQLGMLKWGEAKGGVH